MDDGGVSERSWWKRSDLLIYLSHILSSFGDRLWNFAVGLYLVIIFEESLLLTAIYGFFTCISVIIMGAFIGRWIDKSKRINAARVALIIQNLSVIICAIMIILYFAYKEEVTTFWGGNGIILVYFFIIFVAIIAELASVGTKIALEKDWIVVLCKGNETKLSKMNATMRSIDLTTYILGPIVVGQVLTYVSDTSGAVFIAVWNSFSGFAEIFLLTAIYRNVPELGQKKFGDIPIIRLNSEGSNSSSPEKKNVNGIVNESFDDSSTFEENRKNNNIHLEGESNFHEISLVTPIKENDERKEISNNFDTVKDLKKKKKRFSEARSGWRDYFKNSVRNAGLALAFLYMTVLGFDNITIGYIYGQGVSTSILGLVAAIAAVFGILGSLSFPWLRKKFGKCTAGIIGFAIETTCLVLCVVSIFVTGSPFSPDGFSNPFSSEHWTGEGDNLGQNKTTLAFSEIFSKNTSIALFLIGIICSRFGLWVADLSITQIFQEEVPEEKRGILNGVQGSLNQFMNLIKFFLVILVPSHKTFGYLILLSWLFVFLGLCLFCKYSFRQNKVADQIQNREKSKTNNIEIQLRSLEESDRL